MSSFTQDVWRSAPQTAQPGIGMFLKCRFTGLTPNSQSAQLYLVPDVSGNPMQYKTGNNVAWTSNPAQRHAKPPQGLRFTVTAITLADPNGTLRNTGNLSLNINNLTQGNTVFDVPLVVAGTAAPSGAGQSATFQVSAGVYGIGFVRQINPYDDLQLSFQTPTSTVSTATAVTVIIHGFWL